MRTLQTRDNLSARIQVLSLLAARAEGGKIMLMHALSIVMLQQVAELLVGVAAPILYWEQGHEWLFGDPVRSQVCNIFFSLV